MHYTGPADNLPFRQLNYMHLARLLLIVTAAVLALAAAGAGAQGVYRWTDAQGKVYYTDKPPPNAKSTEVADRINSYAGPPTVTERRGASAAETPGVVMYATSWCPYCKQARAYFQQQGIAYAEHDIERSAAANAEFKLLGGRGVPLILVGNQVMKGFSEKRFESLRAKSKG